jgi:sulfite exporter TauE/SafE
MYIILIGYLYVVLMFSAVAGSIAKGLAIFFIFGFLPTMLIVWLKRGKQIVKERKREEEDQ